MIFRHRCILHPRWNRIKIHKYKTYISEADRSYSTNRMITHNCNVIFVAAKKPNHQFTVIATSNAFQANFLIKHPKYKNSDTKENIFLAYSAAATPNNLHVWSRHPFSNTYTQKNVIFCLNCQWRFNTNFLSPLTISKAVLSRKTTNMLSPYFHMGIFLWCCKTISH